MIARHLFITGVVQGVFYRASTQARARELQVTGWVRNLPDGRVEAHIEGEEPRVNALVEWCHEGPADAQVHRVDVTSDEVRGFDGFEVRTA